MQDVNEGMDARFARFEELLGRLPIAPEEPPARVIPPPDPPVTRSKKRAADQVVQLEPPSPKVSKSARNDKNQATSHSTSCDSSQVNHSVPAQMPANQASQSRQATPRHPSPRFAEQPSFAEQGRHHQNCQQTDTSGRHSSVSAHHNQRPDIALLIHGQHGMQLSITATSFIIEPPSLLLLSNSQPTNP